MRSAADRRERRPRKAAADPVGAAADPAGFDRRAESENQTETPGRARTQTVTRRRRRAAGRGDRRGRRSGGTRRDHHGGGFGFLAGRHAGEAGRLSQIWEKRSPPAECPGGLFFLRVPPWRAERGGAARGTEVPGRPPRRVSFSRGRPPPPGRWRPWRCPGPG